MSHVVGAGGASFGNRDAGAVVPDAGDLRRLPRDRGCRRSGRRARTEVARDALRRCGVWPHGAARRGGFWRGFECGCEARCWRPAWACSRLASALGAPTTVARRRNASMCHGADHEKMARVQHAVAADSRTFGCIGCHGVEFRARREPDREEARPGLPRQERGDGRARRARPASPATRPRAPSRCCCGRAARIRNRASRAPTATQIHVNKDKVFNKAEQPTSASPATRTCASLASRPWRHPIQEGKVTCSDCHSVHGSAGPKLAKRDTRQRHLLHVPRGKARPVRAQPSTGAGQLRELPQPARQQRRRHAALRATRSCATSAIRRTRPAASARWAGSRACSRRRCRRRRCRQSRRCRAAINTVNVWQGRSCLNCHTQVHGSNNPGGARAGAVQPVPLSSGVTP